jgi:hypothetical protein
MVHGAAVQGPVRAVRARTPVIIERKKNCGVVSIHEFEKMKGKRRKRKEKVAAPDAGIY